jgi:hypothetical protein
MNNSASEALHARPNGSAAAAILSAGIGVLSVAILAIVADQSPTFKNLMVIYKPTGALSGVTTLAVLLWLVTWGLLNWRWRKKIVPLTQVNLAAFVLLGLSVLLTFPPIADLF